MIDLPTFPATFYHPVHGAVTVADADEAQKLQPATDWFATAAEADAHRTENEAAIVIHNARRGQITGHEQSDFPGVVKHSVTHQETIDRTKEEAEIVAEATGAPAPKSDQKTQGAELLT